MEYQLTHKVNIDSSSAAHILLNSYTVFQIIYLGSASSRALVACKPQGIQPFTILKLAGSLKLTQIWQ